jgi:eukaryotic-like serine/threonine-protein kinase
MPGRVDPSRDLCLGLHALESGAIQRDTLVSAIRAWSSAPDMTLAEFLASRGVIDKDSLARLEDHVARDLNLPDGLTGLGGATGNRTPRLSDGPDVPDHTATVAYVGLTGDADLAGPGDHEVTRIAGGRFQVIRPHARGGLGEVFLAFDRELNRSVALKELPTSLAHDPAAQARFLLEAEVTGSLEHPGIVPVYSLGRYADGRPFYAMHLVQGETLRAAIDRHHHHKDSAHGQPEDKDLAFRRLLRCVIDACNAVAYAHSRGVIHRDLKPENIMLGRFGETLVVDWGIAKRLVDHSDDGMETNFPNLSAAEASMTQPGSLIGTPRYMSPEQAAGDLDRVGSASDVYSLGAILYCVLAGQGPFPDGDLPDVLGRVIRGIFPAPRRLRRSTDSVLEAICLKAMALDTRERHASPLDLANELETWLADVRYRGEQEVAFSQMKATLARLCIERAHACFDREMHPEGMLWLARGLANAPPYPPDLERVIRTSLTGWHAGTKLLERSLRHGCAVNALAFCPEGRRLVTAGEGRVARIWDLATGSLLATPLRHEGPVRGVAFSPDGKMIATAASDGTIRRWDAWTGEALGEPTPSNGVSALNFSPDGSMLAAISNAREPVLLNTASGKPVRWPDDDRSTAMAIAFAPDGTTIAVGYDDGDVCVHEARSGRPVGAPLAHGSAVRVLEFDIGGTQLLTGCRDGEVRLWDIARRVALVTLTHPGEIRCVSFRPGGSAFATVCDDGTARLWESATGRPIGELLGHSSRVDCLAFRPDGTMVATGCPNGTARLWCAFTGLPIGRALSQGGAVRSLAFSPDGRRLASGGTDMTVRCWKLPNPVEGNAERVSCWVSVTTDLEFDAGDAIRKMDGTTSWDLRRRLEELGGAPLR